MAVHSCNREIMEVLQQIVKEHPRRPWWVMGIIITVLLFFIGRMIFMDDAPPDDAWLLPKIPPESAEKNPLAVFCETLAAHPIEGYSDLIKGGKKFENISTEVMQAFVEKHAIQLAAFDKLLRTNPVDWAWPGLNKDISAITTYPYLTGCNELFISVGRMRTELLIRDQKALEAMVEALKMVRFSQVISSIEGTLFHWIVDQDLKRKSEKMLQAALIMYGTKEETLLQAQEIMMSYEVESKQLRHALSWEYLIFKDTLSRLKTGGIRLEDFGLSQAKPILVFLRTNRTLRNDLARLQPMYDAAGKDWPALLATAAKQQAKVEAWKSNKLRFYINPNMCGNVIIATSATIISNVCIKACSNAALHRQAVTMIALRRYELAEGRLPEKMDALVPKYLPAVPLDPFDNAPMRWDSASGALYSVGSDFKDDGGSFTDPYKSDNKDVGMRYWWKPKGP